MNGVHLQHSGRHPHSQSHAGPAQSSDKHEVNWLHEQYTPKYMTGVTEKKTEDTEQGTAGHNKADEHVASIKCADK